MKFHFFLLFLAFLIFAGCSETPRKPAADTSSSFLTSPEPAGKVIESDDQLCKITTVGAWNKATGLHKKAQLQASNLLKEMYVVVFSEKKERFADITLKDHAEITRASLVKTLTAPVVVGPTQVTVNGLPGLQSEIRGMANNIKVVYLHTDVESPLYFHEIIAWTLDSKYKENKFALQSVINSFQEQTPQAQPTAASPTAK